MKLPEHRQERRITAVTTSQDYDSVYQSYYKTITGDRWEVDRPRFTE